MVEVTIGHRLSEQWRGALPARCRRGPALACHLGGAGEGRGEVALVWRGHVGGSRPVGRGLEAREGSRPGA
jgi:hypothetical protein